MDKNQKAFHQVDENEPILESYTIARSQDLFCLVTIKTQGGRVIDRQYSQPYWLVEAKNKFKVAAAKMFQTVIKDPNATKPEGGHDV